MRKATLLELIVIFALVLVFGICIIGIMDKIWSKDMQRIDKISEIVEKKQTKRRKLLRKLNLKTPLVTLME